MLQNPPEYPQALIWTADRPDQIPFKLVDRQEWQPDFVDRIQPGQSPGQHELHSVGGYYCLDSSSVFSASAMLALAVRPEKIVDMCSAPGGKGIFAWRAFRPELLICNEVIGKRIGALVSNLGRCKIKPVMVVSLDSSRLAENAARVFDLVVCDVPCSGQSLVVRKGESPGCFHPATINMNANRQKRILANSAACVRPGGYLHYITCTYSREENEGVIAWFLKRFPEFMAVSVEQLKPNQSHLADFPAYRLWPQDGIGAGGFSCLLQKSSSSMAEQGSIEGIRVVWQNPG